MIPGQGKGSLCQLYFLQNPGDNFKEHMGWLDSVDRQVLCQLAPLRERERAIRSGGVSASILALLVPLEGLPLPGPHLADRHRSLLARLAPGDLRLQLGGFLASPWRYVRPNDGRGSSACCILSLECQGFGRGWIPRLEMLSSRQVDLLVPVQLLYQMKMFYGP